VIRPWSSRVSVTVWPLTELVIPSGANVRMFWLRSWIDLSVPSEPIVYTVPYGSV
jgi:hypothetical protein